MKRIVSSVLALVMVFSVFAATCISASAASVDAKSKFSVTSTGISDGKITYIVYVEKGVVLENVMITVNFDKDKYRFSEAGPCKDYIDGDLDVVVPGYYEGGINMYDSTKYNFTYITGYSYTVPSKSEYVFITFDVIAENGEDAKVDFYLAEFGTFHGSDLILSDTRSTLETPHISSAKAAAAGVSLSWNPVAGAAQYGVYRKQSGGSWARLCFTTASSYTDKTAKSGQTYYYTVKAFTASNKASNFDTTGVKCSFVLAPVISSVANVKAGIAVKWGAVAGATKYRVYRKEAGGSWATLGDAASTVYGDKTAKAGVKYAYTVRAFCGSVYSAYDTAGKSITRLTQPAVTSLANAATGVTVKWGAVAGAEKYRVYRKVSGGSWAKVADTAAVSCTDKTAVSGTAYYYTVKVINSDCSSSYDTTGKGVKYIATPKISKIAAATNGVSLAWAKVPGATSYTIYRKAGSATAWSKLVNVTATTYTDKNVSSGTKYTYTVRATGGAGTSAYVTSGWAIRYLAAPTLVSATSAKAGITFKWGKVNGASGYYVYRKTGSGGWARIAAVNGGTTVSYLDKSAAKGTTYTYTVKAINGTDASAYRSGVSCKDLY